jgi:TRAP-type C4-dicarboxylate transport system permease small subunit
MLERLHRLNGIVAAFLFAALTIVVSLQVLTRFVLHLPMIWSEELARFLFFWIVMLGAAHSVRTKRHFVIDVGIRGGAFGRAGRILFDVFPDLCVLSFSVFLLVQSIGYTYGGIMRTATNSHVNMALVYGAIPVFALLSVIYSVSILITDIAAMRRRAGASELPPPEGE